MSSSRQSSAPPRLSRSQQTVVDGVVAGLAREAPGRVVLVQGSAGSGRTTVVEAVARAAAAEGFEARRTVAVQRLDGTQEVRLMPEPEDRAHASKPIGTQLLLPDHVQIRAAAVAAGLQRLAGASRLLVVVDGLELVGRPTRVAVQKLLEHLPTMPVTVLATTDGSAAGGAVAPILLAHRDAVLVPLLVGGPDLVEIAGGLLGAPPGPRLVRALRPARHDLRVVTAAVAVLAQEGALEEVADGVDLRPGCQVPTDPGELASRQLALVDEDAHEVLLTAAMLGQRFRAEEVAILEGKPLLPVAAAIRRAARIGVVVDDGRACAFTSPALRGRLLAAHPPSTLPALHHEAGMALLTAGVPAARAAGQLLRAGRGGDARAAGVLADAGLELAAEEPADAAVVLEQAIALGSGDDQLVAAMANCLCVAGEPERAERAVRRRTPLSTDPRGRWSLHVALARSLYTQGRPWEAADVLREALVDAPGAQDAARVTADIQLCRALSGDLAGAGAAAAEALPSEADPVASAVLSITRSIAASVAGDVTEGLAHAREALRCSRLPGGSAAALYTPGLFVSIGLGNIDHLDAARAALEETEHEADRAGVAWTDVTIAAVHAQLDWARGDLAAIDVRAARVLPHVRAHPAPGGPALAAVAAMSALAAGDGERAAQRIADAEAIQAHLPLVVAGAEWVAAIRPLVLAATAQQAAAVDQTRAVWRFLAGTGYRWALWTFGPALVRLALAAGDADLAAEVAEGTADAATRVGTASGQGDAMGVRALVMADPDLAAAAADRHAQGPRRLQTALWEKDAAVLLHRAGRVEEATARSRRAAGVLEQAGARGLGRGLPRIGRRADATAWPGVLGLLTPGQRNVALLVAEGLSNPQIAERLHLSRNTVETHVKAALRRTGCSSRAALASAITRDLGR